MRCLSLVLVLKRVEASINGARRHGLTKALTRMLAEWSANTSYSFRSRATETRS